MSDTDPTSTDIDRNVPTDHSPDTGSAGGSFTSRPTLKPAGIALGITALLVLAIVGLLIANPTLFGTPELTEVVLWVVLLVGGFVSARLLLKMYVLSRMRYVVSNDGVLREYALLYRYRRREMPFQKIRGVEVSRDPIETLLGYGTVSVLSGGTNQSLGFIKFEHVPDPERVSDAIVRYRTEESESPEK